MATRRKRSKAAHLTASNPEPVSGSRLTKKDAVVIARAFGELAAAKQLTPAAVVERARAPADPLHCFFEWDDSRAAHAHRLDQASYLIRSVRVTVQSATIPARTIRYFWPVKTAGVGEGYQTVERVLSDKEMRREMLARAEREFVSWRDRYASLTELARVFAAAEVAFARLHAKKAA
ncbi:MAG: hypothetical protein Q8Q14_10905 [Gemmatimonadales bacterium]|nr:hypothetical protein [Gemmatimonadales bacterium]